MATGSEFKMRCEVRFWHFRESAHPDVGIMNNAHLLTQRILALIVWYVHGRSASSRNAVMNAGIRTHMSRLSLSLVHVHPHGNR